MGSPDMALKLVLISLLVVLLHLTLVTAQDQQENEIVDEPREQEEEGEEGVIRPISDETRRERLRSFFTRKREESSEDAEDSEVLAPRLKPRNRLTRPGAAYLRKWRVMTL